MPNFFGPYEIVAETKNFIVTCSSDNDSRTRAQNVAAVCEYDLSLLNDLFSTNFEAGNTSEHTIWVNAIQAQSTGPNGFNYGYETDRSSRIVLPRTFTPPPPSPPPVDPPPVPPPNFIAAVAEFPRSVFVAELAEILMDFTGYGWGRRNSMGEGLSIVLATLLHPVGYYDTNQGPRINQWLNGDGTPANPPRNPLYVNTTENTDTNIFSFGCSILFINYLVTQRGHSLKEVIRAGGSTLAENYSRVTGEGAFNAFPSFNGVLQFSVGNSTTNNLLRDNIFPIYDVNHRSVQLTVADPINTGIFTDPVPVSFIVQPGLFCSPQGYDFTLQHQTVEQVIYARARGTANASFRWSIQGVDVAVRGKWTVITVLSPVTVKNPDRTTTTITNGLNIQYAIADAGNASVLYLKTLSSAGNISMHVAVAIRELALQDPEVSGDEDISLDAVQWLPSEAFKKASQRCNPFYAAVDKSFWGLTLALSDFKNRPDPPSERAVFHIVESVQLFNASVVQFATAANITSADVFKQIGAGVSFRSAIAPEPETDLAQLAPAPPDEPPPVTTTSDSQQTATLATEEPPK